jgi:4-aminobutyrate aminotransferase / (S)-3-amino-2-methylpropionate transaminase / 5-aminovalerate transaminase
MPTINLVTEIPGPKSRALIARREAITPRGASKLTNVAIERAHGAAVVDVDGNTLLDFAGGIGMLAVGHTPDNVVNALKAQAEKVIHNSAIVTTHEAHIELCELLCSIVPIEGQKKATLMNSGAEAVETAVNIARAYTGRQAIVVFEGAYHGRTNLTLSMTSKYALFKKGFAPFAPEVYRLPFPNLYRKPQGMTDEAFIDYSITQLEYAMVSYADPAAIAAIVIEPVQGESGFLQAPKKFMQRIRELCTEHKIVMIADEIQSGMGRTGKLFAVEHVDVKPDVMTIAKSMGAGMPISAIVGKAEIMDGPNPGGLGGTYSANPLACVAAIEAIKTINTSQFLARATEIGERFRGHMLAIQQENDWVGDVRGVGPMLVMEFVSGKIKKTPVTAQEVMAVTNEALKRGLIIIRSGLFSNCIRLLPPLMLTDEQIDEGMEIFAEAVRIGMPQREKAIGD